MRYKLIAEVEGNLFVPEGNVFEFHNTHFDFIRNPDGKLIKIAVSKEVPPDKLESFRQIIEDGDGEVTLTISIGGDQELHNELVKELQILESNLAFSSQASLKRIRWDVPQQEYVPENIEDETLIPIKNISTDKKYSEKRAKITLNSIEGLVRLAPHYESLIMAKAFWREGMVYFDNFQCVQAFYQFYFVIEDFFIAGKTSSKSSVMKIFQKSKELLDIAKDAITSTLNLPNHKIKLEKHLREYNCQFTSLGLLEMLYEARNNLHHFHSKSSRKQGTPFNQSEFETIAFATMYIATAAITYREVRISQSLKIKKES